MKLVMIFTIGDGCSWHQDITLPIEYESEEALICDFESALLKAITNKENNFYIKEYEFETKYHKDILPDIFTLERWFDVNKI